MHPRRIHKEERTYPFALGTSSFLRDFQIRRNRYPPWLVLLIHNLLPVDNNYALLVRVADSFTAEVIDDSLFLCSTDVVDGISIHHLDGE